MTRDAANATIIAGSPVPPVVAFGIAMAIAMAGFAINLVFVFVPAVDRAYDAVRAGAVALAVLAAIPTRVELGPDALRLRWLFRTRLVRYDEIRRAAPLGRDVVVVLKNGSAIRFSRPLFGGGSPQILLSRIWQTLSAGAEGGARGAERALLARSGRRMRAWVESLREIAPKGAQYRRAIDLERLWTIVENPAEGGEIRAAAGVALSPSFDEAARERLRALARTTVDQPVREALSRIAEADDVPALEAALAIVAGTSHA